MRFYCINPYCGKRVDKVLFGWHGEIVCKECWKTVPQHLKSHERDWRRAWARMEKQELQFGRTWETIGSYDEIGRYTSKTATWYDLAQGYAYAWSKIRLFFQITPERPAGLAMFFYEMGWRL